MNIGLVQVVALTIILLMSGCGQTWRTDYHKPPDRQLAAQWKVVGVVSTVPRSLSVSEANTFAPDADIVWREDPPGDRYEQVGRIMQDAVTRGTVGLHGQKAVRVEVTVNRFHALTEKTRYSNYQVGVHNIGFAIRVIDAHSGIVLASEDEVDADLIAYTGLQALEAVRRGETQRVRITRHIAAVVAGWLGTGPDVRGAFSRSGR